MIIFLCFGCNENSFKSNMDIHQDKFLSYTDSFIKYVQIHTDESHVLSHYYSKLAHQEYLLMYPNNNP